MKPFDVIIRAIIVKSIRVQADSHEEAIETAHELFTSDCDDQELRYEQETIDVLQPELITGE